jgi:hypothetical protein
MMDEQGNDKAMDCKMIFASSPPTFPCPLIQVILLLPLALSALSPSVLYVSLSLSALTTKG